MRSRVGLSFLAMVLAFVVGTPVARAAPVSYAVSLGNNQHSELTIDGGQLTALRLTAFVPSCVGGAGTTWSITIGLPGGPVPILGGVLHVETEGVSGYPDTGVHVAIDGMLTTDAQTLSGTITYSGLHTPAETGCPPVTADFVAIPLPALVPPDPEHQWTLTGANVRVDATNGHITRVKAVVPFACSLGLNESDFDTRAYGISDIPVSASGAFSLSLNVLDEYSVVRVLTITGTLSSGAFSARFQIASTNVGGWNGDCVGDATFAAGAGRGTALPTPDAPGAPGTLGSSLPGSVGPSALISWGALRRDTTGGSLFYFLAGGVRCQRGATHVRISINGGRNHTVRCGASIAYASGPLAPDRGYFARLVAIKVRRHRVVAHGLPVLASLHMPAANAAWRPIAHIPANPPRI